MKNLCLIFIVLVAFGCSKESGKTYFVEFDNVKSLSKGNTVFCKGVPIGTIESLRLSPQHHVIVEVKIDDRFQIRKSFLFELVPLDLFGKQAIDINPEGLGEYVNEKDTLMGSIVLQRGPIQKLDSTEANIAIDSVLKATKN